MRLIPVYNIAKALGYSKFNNDNSLLALIFKNHQFVIYRKYIGRGRAAYLCDACQIVPILQSFIRLTLTTRDINSVHVANMDNMRMEAERLIEVFNRELFGKADTCTVTQIPKETCDTTEEVTQMENNETIQATVPPVTTADIEEIGERAEATVKIFGVSKTDALRVVTQLKAQEINRDLSPLLELLR